MTPEQPMFRFHRDISSPRRFPEYYVWVGDTLLGKIRKLGKIWIGRPCGTRFSSYSKYKIPGETRKECAQNIIDQIEGRRNYYSEAKS